MRCASKTSTCASAMAQSEFGTGTSEFCTAVPASRPVKSGFRADACTFRATTSEFRAGASESQPGTSAFRARESESAPVVSASRAGKPAIPALVCEFRTGASASPEVASSAPSGESADGLLVTAAWRKASQPQWLFSASGRKATVKRAVLQVLPARGSRRAKSSRSPDRGGCGSSSSRPSRARRWTASILACWAIPSSRRISRRSTCPI